MTKETNIPVNKYFFNIQEYHRMEEAGIIPADIQVELIHGEIIKMSPIKSPHAGTVKLLNRLLARLIDDHLILSIQDPIEVDSYSEPEPDVAILKFRDDLYTTAHPKAEDALLLIEVADTSLEKDREIKLPLYAKAAIKEVWIVNLNDLQIEIYTKPNLGGYTNAQIYKKGERIQHQLLGDLSVDNILI